MNRNLKHIHLYSTSPRRRELLSRLGLPFSAWPVEVDETVPSGLSPAESVSAIALRKLEAGIISSGGAKNRWGLAADTLVEGPSGLLGKAADRCAASTMLKELSGITHYVHSGFAISSPNDSYGAETRVGVHTTLVQFRKLSETEISTYLDTEEWKGVAGAYRIQENGAVLIERIEGLWSTVVGLPLGPVYGMLSAMSYPFG